MKEGIRPERAAGSSGLFQRFADRLRQLRDPKLREAARRDPAVREELRLLAALHLDRTSTLHWTYAPCAAGLDCSLDSFE